MANKSDSSKKLDCKMQEDRGGRYKPDVLNCRKVAGERKEGREGEKEGNKTIVSQSQEGTMLQRTMEQGKVHYLLLGFAF